MSQNDVYQTRLAVNQTTPGKSKATRTDAPTATSKATQPYKPKKPVGKMLLFGAVSLSAYVFLFMNESMITNTYTLGGWHAAFPVGTAFFFSFIHGAFASNFLSVLGLEAKKK
jgi:uncharacterized integral membrane protein